MPGRATDQSIFRPAGVATPEGEPINLKGRLVTAGLINGHHHSHEGFFKGRELPLELWMRAFKPIALTPRDVYLRTMIGAIEAVRSALTIYLQADSPGKDKGA